MTQNGTGLLRPRFFDRQQLRAADLTAAQDYLRERLRRHNRFLHGWGVVGGAEVTAAGSEDYPWLVSIGEGYVVTPGGDEVCLPALPAHDIREGVEACLGTAPPCPDPTDLGEITGDGELRIIRASINPPGKDIRGEYNEEWVDLMLLEDTNLDDYEVEHTINPGTPNAALRLYYRFQENTALTAGTIVRIHSGAVEDNLAPAPGIIHRYVADPGEKGNWRLNNQRDTIRVLDAGGAVVDTQSFLPGSYLPLSTGPVYLVACPGEEETCAQPAVPVACQPPGGAYEFSRVCETYDLQIRCDLPPSHEDTLSCEDLEAIVCGGRHPDFPAAPAAGDNCVVLATIHVLEDNGLSIDDLSDRRLLLSESLWSSYLQCQCETAEPPVVAFIAQPMSGTAPLNVQFTDQSSGNITGRSWNFGDGGTSSQPSPSHIYQAQGFYGASLTVTGPGGTTTVGGLITVVAQAPNAAFIVQPDSGLAPLTVQFTDRSSGDITGWSWNFGDGGGSSQQNPGHIYQQPGIYTVTLTVTGPGGTNTSSGIITVGPLILDIESGVVDGTFRNEHQVMVVGLGLTDATDVEFLDIENILSATIIQRKIDGILVQVRLAPNPTNKSRSPFTVSLPDGTILNSGSLMLRILNIRIISVDGDSFPIDLDEAEFDLIRGFERPIEAVSGIGDVRGRRLRTADMANVLALATLPPERTAEIAEVSVEMATQWQEEARELLRR